MTTSALSVDGLAAGYDNGPVLHGVSLYVAPGEVVAMLGPNGAGKSTTLRAISGLIRMTEGQVRLAGSDLAPLSPSARARAGIAHVPEDRGLFRGMTVAEHLRLGPRKEKLDADAAYEYFPALRAISGRMAGVLSGGEQQMLAMARALARKPSVLLLDELSLGLAPLVVERLLPVVRTYATEHKCAVLLVEQHVHLALGIADRAYLMASGVSSSSYDAHVLRNDMTLVQASYLGGPEWASEFEDESKLPFIGEEAQE
ncbi:MAG: ABC transporter ATP-binding protein [Actinomycetota bacterium]|nr:ABC transporter ATP-binding protein [Actinomycetota bacterium]